jgi:hypothetical protein
LYCNPATNDILAPVELREMDISFRVTSRSILPASSIRSAPRERLREILKELSRENRVTPPEPVYRVGVETWVPSVYSSYPIT